MRKEPTETNEPGNGGCPEERQTCSRCRGTGLVCGHVPEISPGCCCVDYANAICPDCRGSGLKRA